jgi:hypothetical protein
MSSSSSRKAGGGGGTAKGLGHGRVSKPRTTVPRHSMPKCFIRNKDGQLPAVSNGPPGTKMDEILQQVVMAGAQARSRSRGEPKIMQALTAVPKTPHVLLPQQVEQQRQKEQSIKIHTIPLGQSITTQESALRPGKYRCALDTGMFDGIPYVVPTVHVPSKDVYIVSHKRYCSPGCAKRACIMKNDALSQRRLTWLCDILRRYYKLGYHKRITAAPPQDALEIFGGNYTIEEYRSKSEQGVVTTIVEAPFIIQDVSIAEFDSRSARAHVDWLRQHKQQSTTPVVKKEPPPSPRVTTPQVSFVRPPTASDANNWFNALVSK